jgi:hypothetical protein
LWGQKDLKPQIVADVERVIVPVIPNIHQKVLEAVTRTPDALDMGNWHTCETTHCRAGWVVTLAGEAGKRLEAFHNTALAASLIYHASSPDLLVTMPRFYESNEVAMADIQKMAALEVAALEVTP